MIAKSIFTLLSFLVFSSNVISQSRKKQIRLLKQDILMLQDEITGLERKIDHQRNDSLQLIIITMKEKISDQKNDSLQLVIKSLEEALASKGKSNKTTANNSNNTGTSTKISTNPFGTDGGSGTGKGAGTGTGTGNGGTAARVRIKDPNIENIISDVNHTIYLKVKIDENGNVTSAISTAKSTTTNPQILNKVIAATIAQTRYNKKPGARIEDGFITVKIRAR